MNIKLASLAAVALGASSPAFAVLNVPVPAENYITFGGNDWAWASPCPPSGASAGQSCGSPNSVDLSYQGTQGWRLPTAAELLAGPSPSDFGTASNFKCAAAWFNTLYTHCDFGDGSSVWADSNSPWYSETWVIRSAVSGAVPEPAAWAMMIGGLGLVGATMRRRRKVAVSFA